MKLNPVGSNQTEIEKADGTTVLYSYKTPVAVFVSGKGALVTAQKYSVTTGRHINQADGDDPATGNETKNERGET